MNTYVSNGKEFCKACRNDTLEINTHDCNEQDLYDTCMAYRHMLEDLCNDVVIGEIQEEGLLSSKVYHNARTLLGWE